MSKLFGKIRDGGMKLLGKARTDAPKLFGKVQNGLNQVQGNISNANDIASKIVNNSTVKAALGNNATYQKVANAINSGAASNYANNMVNKAQNQLEVVKNRALDLNDQVSQYV